MATAEHREPCDSRGSCTVLGAPGGEIPSGDSPFATFCENDAMQRKQPFTGLPNHRYRRRESIAAVPSEAESRRSSVLRRADIANDLPVQCPIDATSLSDICGSSIRCILCTTERFGVVVSAPRGAPSFLFVAVHFASGRGSLRTRIDRDVKFDGRAMRSLDERPGPEQSPTARQPRIDLRVAQWLG
jgi:hypothetical protein